MSKNNQRTALHFYLNGGIFVALSAVRKPFKTIKKHVHEIKELSTYASFNNL